MTIYLDANVFIFASLGSEIDPRTHASRRFLNLVVKGDEDGFTSVLTVDEVVWAILRQKKDRTLALMQGVRLHNLPIKFIGVSEVLSLKSLRLMELYPSLKPRDALHGASCLAMGIKTIVSDDPDFTVIRGLTRVGLK